MKVIVTGSTGYIGKGVLEQCLSHPSITKVVALSRRPLVDESNPKLQVILMEHFDAYTDDTIAELVGADACIWYESQASRCVILWLTLPSQVLGHLQR
jgi:uncharacterized protein YbjT (DUF2867 family)